MVCKIMKRYGFERGRCNEFFCDIILFYVKKRRLGKSCEASTRRSVALNWN